MGKRKAADVEAEEATEDVEVEAPAPKRSRRGAASTSAAAEEAPVDVKGVWKEFNGVLTFTPQNPKGGAKIAGFDIDDTIITTKSGKTFATNANDWQFWDASVPEKLKEYHANGYKIVFFSNQNGISKGQTTAQAFQTKLNKVLAAIPVPVQIYAATEGGKYRKPATGMWGMFVNGGNQGVKPDLKQSLYVGDASGRQKDWAPGKKKDFSDSDRKFAMNLEIDFKTPEEFFQGAKPIPFVLSGVDPKTIKKDGPLYEPATAELISKNQEMVIMVGYPGSGKSFFTVKELEGKGGYVRVNRDTLKTKEKCLKVAEAALGEGKSVVIDNTNPDKEARSPYMQLAKEYKIPVRAFVMQTSYDESLHNNHFRSIITNGETPSVPTIVYNTFRKKYQEPSKAEGFSEIIKTYFRPKFDDAFTEKIFYHWTPH